MATWAYLFISDENSRKEQSHDHKSHLLGAWITATIDVLSGAAAAVAHLDITGAMAAQ